MQGYKHQNGRFTARGAGGRFKKTSFEDLFGVTANTEPLICGKCGYGGNGEFIPILKSGYCPICNNQEGHTPLKRIKEGAAND